MIPATFKYEVIASVSIAVVSVTSGEAVRAAGCSRSSYRWRFCLNYAFALKIDPTPCPSPSLPGTPERPPPSLLPH